MESMEGTAIHLNLPSMKVSHFQLLFVKLPWSVEADRDLSGPL